MITDPKEPGPASSEGERLPTNPAILVGFSAKPKKYILLKNNFFAFLAINVRLLFEILHKKGLRGAGAG